MDAGLAAFSHEARGSKAGSVRGEVRAGGAGVMRPALTIIVSATGGREQRPRVALFSRL